MHIPSLLLKTCIYSFLAVTSFCKIMAMDINSSMIEPLEIDNKVAFILEIEQNNTNIILSKVNGTSIRTLLDRHNSNTDALDNNTKKILTEALKKDENSQLTSIIENSDINSIISRPASFCDTLIISAVLETNCDQITYDGITCYTKASNNNSKLNDIIALQQQALSKHPDSKPQTLNKHSDSKISKEMGMAVTLVIALSLLVHYNYEYINNLLAGMIQTISNQRFTRN